MTSVTRSRVSEPTSSGRTRKNSTMKPLSGSAAAASTASVIAAPRNPTNAPSKTNGQRMNASEAPTRRMISISSARAKTARRIVLTMMNRAMTPTTRRRTVPAVRRMFGDGQDPLDEVLDVDDVADDRVLAQGVADVRTRGRVDELDLEAGVERVAVEVLGQVLAALRLHRVAEALERELAGDVRRRRRPRAWPRAPPGASPTWRSVDVGLEVGDDLDLLLGELEPRQQARSG